MPTVKFPSGTGKAGVPGGGKINLSQAEIVEWGRTGAFPMLRIQWWNSKDRPTKGAWLELPVADMVEFAVTIIEEACRADPKMRNDVFESLMRIAACANADVQHVDKE